MRDDCEGHEPRSRKFVRKPTPEALTSEQKAYNQGYEDGVEEAKKQFMQTQLLIHHTGGEA